MKPLPSASGFWLFLKVCTKRSGVQILQEGKIPSATSAADFASTWASGTQSAGVALLRRLTWDPHAGMADDVAVDMSMGSGGGLSEVQYEVHIWQVQMAEGSVPGINPEGSRSICGMPHWWIQLAYGERNSMSIIGN
ncbi:hypothetical protein Tco_0770441 [Tanacetum coccineum]|uniref:Uncharacterized protein n=1 Tax=Tanacetum coccineum TaxID=301880 RepID=A0ABQ4ZFL1_9ASTR